MSDAEVPEDVREFLYENVESYEALTVLLFLHARPAGSWDAETIGAEVRIPFESATQALSELREKGLASPAAGPGSYTYAGGEHSSIIARLAALYEAQPLDIMRLMNANAIHRLRTSMMKSFSNAFIVGKKKKDG